MSHPVESGDESICQFDDKQMVQVQTDRSDGRKKGRTFEWNDCNLQ